MLRPLCFRATEPRPWEGLSDAERAALAPYCAALPPAAAPSKASPARLDAILRIVADGLHWDEAGDTIHHQFRRWSKTGLFARLLKHVDTSKNPMSWLTTVSAGGYGGVTVPVTPGLECFVSGWATAEVPAPPDRAAWPYAGAERPPSQTKRLML